MKYWIFLLVFALVLGIAGLLVPLFPGSQPESEIPLSSMEILEPAEPFPSFDRVLPVKVLKDGQIITMNMEDYLIGVLGAEMPPDFPEEALRAQAIAARTLTLHQAASGKHPEGAVCTDACCCQGWSPERYDSVTAAVEATDGLVLTYGGQLIDATFFSCSGGRTESAQAVWGGDVPYLRSVESPGEENAPRDTEALDLSPEFFAESLAKSCPDLQLEGSPEAWLGDISRTEGGGIDTAEFCGVPIRGTELRRLFSLRSTNMDFDMGDDRIRITTHGYGHRVGLSQYGAKAMAEAGADFKEILLHYYAGTEILRLTAPEQKKSPFPERKRLIHYDYAAV